MDASAKTDIDKSGDLWYNKENKTIGVWRSW